MVKLNYGYDNKYGWTYIISENKKTIKMESFLTKDEMDAVIEQAKLKYKDIEIIKESKQQ